MSKWNKKKAPKVPDADRKPAKCPSCPCVAHWSPSTNLCGHCRMGYPCPSVTPNTPSGGE